MSAPYLLNQMTYSGQTSYIVTLGWIKDSIRFGDLDLISRSPHYIKTVKMSLVCTLSPEPIGGFCLNLHRNTIERRERNN